VEESWTQASSSCLCQKKQGAIGQTTSSWIPSSPQTAFTVVPQIMCKGRRVQTSLALSWRVPIYDVQGKRDLRFLLLLWRASSSTCARKESS
jgi:hypothetical protein